VSGRARGGRKKKKNRTKEPPARRVKVGNQSATVTNARHPRKKGNKEQGRKWRAKDD